MPIRICCGDIEQLKSDDAQLIIVDLGFSKDKPSTWVLVNDDDDDDDKNSEEYGECKDGKCKFGAAVKKVADALKKAEEENKAINLVLEAPLSYAFDKDRNPAFRKGEQSDGKHRGWYYGAGATTALAAMFFLCKMISKFNEDIENGNLDEDKNICIYLYEGFVSFKDEPTDHKKDCERLLEAIEKVIKNDDPSGNIGEGSRPNILDVLKLTPKVKVVSNRTPLIIFADAPS